MKKLTIQRYMLPADCSSADINAITDRILESRELNPRSSLGVIVSSTPDILENSLKQVRKISKDIPGPAMDILKSSARQLSAALLMTSLQKKKVSAGLIDLSRMNLIFHKSRITDRIRRMTPSALKNVISRNNISILFTYKMPHSDKKVPVYYQDSDFFAITVASFLSPQACEFFFDKKQFFKKLDNVVWQSADKKILTHTEMMGIAAGAGVDIFSSELFRYARDEGVDLGFRDIKSGETFLEVKRQLKRGRKTAKNDKKIVSGITEKTDIAKIRISFQAGTKKDMSPVLRKFCSEKIAVSSLVYNTYDSTAPSVSFVVAKKDLESAMMILEYQKEDLAYESVSQDANVSILSLVGPPGDSALIASINEVLSAGGIGYEVIESCSDKVSILLSEDVLKKTRKLLEKELLS